MRSLADLTSEGRSRKLDYFALGKNRLKKTTVTNIEYVKDATKRTLISLFLYSLRLEQEVISFNCRKEGTTQVFENPRLFHCKKSGAVETGTWVCGRASLESFSKELLRKHLSGVVLGILDFQ